MKKYKKYSNYELCPYKRINGFDSMAFSGYDKLKTELEKCFASGKKAVFDLYPGVDKAEIFNFLNSMNSVKVFDTDECKLSQKELYDRFKYNITDDRVFGVMSHAKLIDCFDDEKLKTLREEIDNCKENTVVIGVGTSLACSNGELFYFDMPRWEIQLQYRAGGTNWLFDNADAPILTKYKIGFFIEWRLADRHKETLFDKIDFLVDTSKRGEVSFVTGEAFRGALSQISKRPFRMQPYFDPGVWGGQWMKGVFGLDSSKENYAWSFDGVPEENSLNLRFGDVSIEVPCMDLVLTHPIQLLGDRVHARFGKEFPIRFDLLDTMDGENLSLQVHPLTEYIQQEFGMHYTQDESYYILDAEDDACVYLGVRDGVNPNELKDALSAAQSGKADFDAERFVNKIPIKKHDHVLIPAGTVHCSGKNTMVLEISATPYIFTFKLWDWGRLGLDGLPRPIHIEHGMKNIQFDRTTDWVNSQLIHKEEVLSDSGDVKLERTGLHSREFIDTLRITFKDEYVVTMTDSVNMLNLIEGEEITVHSTDGSFEPMTVHYAETFIVPASVKEYILKNSTGKPVSVICASVR